MSTNPVEHHPLVISPITETQLWYWTGLDWKPFPIAITADNLESSEAFLREINVEFKRMVKTVMIEDPKEPVAVVTLLMKALELAVESNDGYARSYADQAGPSIDSFVAEAKAELEAGR